MGKGDVVPKRSSRIMLAFVAVVSATVALVLAAPGFAEAAFPGENGKIAFTESTPTGSSEIFVMNQDGSGVTDLTNNPAQDLQPAWSPDGTKIAFASDRADGNGATDIYVMNADGTDVTRLTFTGHASLPAWSPDGTQIAFTSTSVDTQDDIEIMNSNGTNVSDLTNSEGFDAEPAWSPDGTTIAYTRTPWDIYTINSNGTGRAQLTKESGTNGYPDWSPTGSQITFASDRSGGWQIYKMDANGEHQTELTTSSEENLGPVWSPDGTKILASGDGVLYTMNLDGTGKSSLDVNGSQPDWQPLIAGHHPPLASFTISSSTPETDQQVTFKSTSTGGSGSVASQSWDLDDNGEFDNGTGVTASTSFSTPGPHIVRLSVVNSQGVTDAVAETVNVIAPPDTSIDSGPVGATGDNTPTFTFSSATPGSSFECRVNTSSFEPCTSPFTTSTLADGTNLFEVRAKDEYGYVDPTPSGRSFTVNTPPETTITAGPSGLSTSNSAVFEFTSTEPSTFLCRLDGGNWTPCTSPWTYSGLANGSHSFEVNATDAYGNIQVHPAITFWTVDAISPAVALNAKGTQHLQRQRGIVIEVGCPSEACQLSAVGSVAMGSKTFKLGAVTTSLPAGGTVTLKLRLGKRAFKEVVGALQRRKRVVATVAVTVQASSGNRNAEQTKIKLR